MSKIPILLLLLCFCFSSPSFDLSFLTHLYYLLDNPFLSFSINLRTNIILFTFFILHAVRSWNRIILHQFILSFDIDLYKNSLLCYYPARLPLQWHKATLTLIKHKWFWPFCHLNRLWKVRRQFSSMSTSSVPFFLLWRNEGMKQSGCKVWRGWVFCRSLNSVTCLRGIQKESFFASRICNFSQFTSVAVMKGVVLRRRHWI